MSEAVLMTVSLALRLFDRVARYLEDRNISIADLQARRLANGGSLSLKDLDEIEDETFEAVDGIPEPVEPL